LYELNSPFNMNFFFCGEGWKN